MKNKIKKVELDMNRVDRIRDSVNKINKLEYKLFYLMTTDKLTLNNSMATDKEKVEWLEETNAVFEELVFDLLAEM